METDKKTAEVLKEDFFALNEVNKKNVIKMTKFLVLAQNTIVPGLLEEKDAADIFIEIEKTR
jgi:hypothetical protein